MIQMIDPALESYALNHSRAPSALLQELERYTNANVELPQMLCGGLEGAILRFLVQLTGAANVLELGLFTGYSALTMAEASPKNGRIISCEVDPEIAAIAQSFFDRSPVGSKIEIRVGPAVETLQTLSKQPCDLVFLDADKENYSNYFDLIIPMLNTGGLIVADNVLWSGKVLDPKEASDKALASFNDKVHSDPRVEVVMLPIRDGISLIRKI